MDISGGSESLFRGYGRSPVPGRMRPPFSFFLKKRMRRARWKRKSLLPHNRPCGPVGGNAGVFRIGADQTCQPSAGCGVHWLLSMLLRRSLQNPGSHRGVEDRKVGPPCPAHSASLCAARAVPGEGCQALSNHQGASAKEKQGESGSGSFHRSPATANVRQQKRSRRASGTSPSFRTRHTRLSGPGHRSLPSQNPRNRRRERSGRSPECRRPSLFLLHHQKAHSLFPL